MTTLQHLQQRKAQASIDAKWYREQRDASTDTYVWVRYNNLIEQCNETYGMIVELIKLIENESNKV